MKNEEFVSFSLGLYGFFILHFPAVRIFSKKKNRSNLLIIFAGQTTDIWKEIHKNKDNINSCFNFR